MNQPHDLGAERALLGAALLSMHALETLAVDVQPEEFYRPAHAHLARAMVKLWGEGQVRVDAVTVADRMTRDGTFENLGGHNELAAIQAEAPGTANAPHYARLIRDHATCRRLIGVGESIVRAGHEQTAVQAMSQARELIGSVDLPVGDSSPSPTLGDILAEPEEYDWLVEGLLERGDRVLFTGTEGFGKSTLCRQVSIMVAAGMHPFHFHPIPAKRVLIVDCENSRRQVRRKFAAMEDKLHSRLDPGMLRIETPNGGLDLLRPHDHRWLVERVAVNQPDLLVIGPIYKLHNGDPFEEAPAKQVTSILDMIRTRYGCALMMEAHAPHQTGTSSAEDLRPYGASLWKRWPEFGYGLAEDKGNDDCALFRPWRGDRDERDWPTVLKRGKHWPWEIPEWAQGRRIAS